MTGWSCDGNSGMLASTFTVRRGPENAWTAPAPVTRAHMCVHQTFGSSPVVYIQHMQHSEEAKSSSMQEGWNDRSRDLAIHYGDLRGLQECSCQGFDSKRENISLRRVNDYSSVNLI